MVMSVTKAKGDRDDDTLGALVGMGGLGLRDWR